MYNAPEHYLNADAAASRILSHARLLTKLSRRFEQIAPSALRHLAHVANYKSGKIVIHADNGAVAARLRQLSRRLCSELSLGGAECSDIEVKVQPQQLPLRSIASTPKPLSAKSTEILRSTASSLPPGPLRQALERLWQRAATAE
ncbi:MAG: DciA family protein [Dechloromonas sp.]|nr:DciA family protein [Dechloromonas sp.]